MVDILKVLVSIIYLIFTCDYFWSEFKKGNFKAGNWVAGRGQKYFSFMFFGIIATYVIISELLNFIQ